MVCKVNCELLNYLFMYVFQFVLKMLRVENGKKPKYALKQKLRFVLILYFRKLIVLIQSYCCCLLVTLCAKPKFAGL